MALWLDVTNGQIWDDMGGTAQNYPSWPSGLVAITQEQATALQKPSFNYVWDSVHVCWCRGVQATLWELQNLKDSKLAAGYLSGGHYYQIRDMDMVNLVTVVVAISQGITNPHGGIWRTVDNQNIAFTDLEIKALAVSAITYKEQLLRAWSAHKDAIAAIVASHPVAFDADEAAEDYDITAGWPT